MNKQPSSSRQSLAQKAGNMLSSGPRKLSPVVVGKKRRRDGTFETTYTVVK